MLKKVSILGLAIMLLVSVMSGCISTGYLNEESSAIAEQTTTTPIPTTTPVNKDAISAQLAQLTNEDGTGIINLEMSFDEVESKLKDYNIPYKKNEYGAIITGDGSYYSVSGDASFELMRTKSGLKVGDSLSRVIELYGQPDKKNTDTNLYIYYTGKTSYDRPIDFTVKGSNNIVDSITISVRPYVGGMEE